MRVLLVSHDFLPRHAMGTEVYTWHMGRALQRRGHVVDVFTTEKDITLPNLGIRLREYDGLPVHELTNNLFFNEFRETWDYPPAARSFGVFLDDFRPDVVHFMHLLYLSVACIEEVYKRKIPIFYTLHDYWLQCSRWGQRKHRDGSICHTIDFDRCGTCMEGFKYRQTRLERATAKALARVRSLTGIDLKDVAREGVARLRGGGSPTESGDLSLLHDADAASAPLSDAARERAEEIRERDRALRERLVPRVDRFLAPSRFLRDRFLEWGIPPERIDYLRTGIDLTPFEGFQRPPRGQKVRIAFVGTVAPHKGTHLLLESWLKLSDEVRANAELLIYGPLDHYPSYVRHCKALAERCGVDLAGRIERSDVARTLGEIDVLVIPSIWYENSPLIILEGLATRTPLLVSDLGGMAELVEEGMTGYHFKVGDVDSLAEQLTRLVTEPDRLGCLYPREFRVQGIDHDAAFCEHLYDEALAERARE